MVLHCSDGGRGYYLWCCVAIMAGGAIACDTALQQWQAALLLAVVRSSDGGRRYCSQHYCLVMVSGAALC